MQYAAIGPGHVDNRPNHPNKSHPHPGLLTYPTSLQRWDFFIYIFFPQNTMKEYYANQLDQNWYQRFKRKMYFIMRM